MRLLVEPYEKKIFADLFDDHEGDVPDFTIAEQVPLNVGLIRRNSKASVSRIFTPIDPADWTIRASLGAYRAPVGGTFTTIYEAEESPILVPAADTTAADLERSMNEIEGIEDIGGVTVTGDKGFFVIAFNLAGARSEFMADATQAIPSLILRFERIIIGDVDNSGVQTLRIEQNIASLADLDAESDPEAATFVVDAGTDVFTSAAHGLTAGARIKLYSTGALPTGLSDLAEYFVLPAGLTVDEFKLSATPGGSSVNATDTGSGTHSFVPSAIDTLIAGDATHSAKYSLTLPANRWNGDFVFIVNGKISDLIFHDDGAEEIQSAIEGIEGVGAGNVDVSQTDDDEYSVLFKGALRLVAVPVAADLRGLKLIKTKGGVLDLRNAQVQFLLEGPEPKPVILELSIADPAGTLVKAQFAVMLTKPIIEEDSVIAPFPASNYYTTEQIDALLAGIAGENTHAIEEFTATNGQTVFNLAHSPSDTPIMFIRGLLQNSADFSYVGAVLTLDSGADIVAGDEVLIFYFY